MTTTRPKTRIQALPLMTLLATAMTISARSNADTYSTMLWPNTGAFPAYPRDDSGPRFTAYALTTLGVDDNIFRLNDSFSASDGRSDWYARLGGGVSGDMDVSRQHFHVDGNAEHYSFNRYSILNRWLYGANADWLWNLGSSLSGDIGYTRDRLLPNFADVQQPTTDAVLHQYAHASLNLRVNPHLEVRTLAEGTRYDHDDPLFFDLNNRVGAGTAGLFYVTSDQTAIGGQYKESHGEYPNLQRVGTRLIDNSYRETETSGVISKDFTARTGLTIRVGYTRREHEDIPERDFRGTTGRGQLRYSPSPKTLLEFAAYRELQAIEDLSTSYALVRGASFGPAWAPTLRTVLQAVFVYEQRTFSGNPGIILVSSFPREDRSRIGRLSAGYRPNRHWEVSLAYEHGNRSANDPLFDYEYNSGTLNLKASF